MLLLQVTARAKEEYEWVMRVHNFSAEAGLSNEQIAAAVNGCNADPCWQAEGRAVLKLADAIEDECDGSVAVWEELSALFADETLIEMAQLASTIAPSPHSRTRSAFLWRTGAAEPSQNRRIRNECPE